MRRTLHDKRFIASASSKPRHLISIPLALAAIGIFALASVWVLFHHVEKASTTRSQGASLLVGHNHNERRPNNNDQITSSDSDSDGTTIITNMLIPTPVFVTSLPKSGTTSTWKYFLCGLGKGQAAHQWASVNNGTQQVRLGKCLRDNLRQERPLLEGCGDYRVWTDVGFLAPGICFYPSIHGGLQALVKDYPQATIVQVVRDTESWVNSTTEFNDLWTRWSDKCDHFPDVGSTRTDYANFYEWHTQMVRQFAQDHPSLTFIEVSLEGADTGEILESATGINASCWVHSKTKKGKRARPFLMKQRALETGKTED